MISYNFDHDNPTNNNSITHNIFIGWDDEPTKKKPIKKIKIHQTPSVIRTRTPVRNRITITNNVVS